MPLTFTTRFIILETGYHEVATAANNIKRVSTIFPPGRYWYLCIRYTTGTINAEDIIWICKDR